MKDLSHQSKASFFKAGVAIAVLLATVQATCAQDMYVTLVNQSGAANQLARINVATGVATTIGSTGYTQTFATAFTPDGQLWTIVRSLDTAQIQLARLNTSTGAATLVGSPMGEWSVRALESTASGQMYAMGYYSRFYSINLATGAATYIGGQDASLETFDLALDPTTGLMWYLAASAYDNFNLYTINLATGVKTWRCRIAGQVTGQITGIAFDNSGNLFGVYYSSPSRLYSINKVTGYCAQINANIGTGWAYCGDIAGAPTSPGSLSVTPAANFYSSGPAAGPFSPPSQTYRLTNTGQTTISFSATDDSSWVYESPTSGSLAPGAFADVVVSISQIAAPMAAGVYNASASFVNTTNGLGNTSRGIQLTVRVPCGPADLNRDGLVDLNDLTTLLVNFGTASGAAPEDGDLDGDGDVELDDLAGLLAAFGSSC